MKNLLPFLIVGSFVLSSCIIVPKRGQSRHGVHNQRCHPSESWDGHKCRKRGKGHDKGHGKGHGKGHDKGKHGRGHDHRD